MRRWLIVVDDPKSDLTTEEEAAAWFAPLIEEALGEFKVALVRRGGILAEQLVGSFVPVRHSRMGRGRG